MAEWTHKWQANAATRPIDGRKLITIASLPNKKIISIAIEFLVSCTCEFLCLKRNLTSGTTVVSVSPSNSIACLFRASVIESISAITSYLPVARD